MVIDLLRILCRCFGYFLTTLWPRRCRPRLGEYCKLGSTSWLCMDVCSTLFFKSWRKTTSVAEECFPSPHCIALFCHICCHHEMEWYLVSGPASYDPWTTGSPHNRYWMSIGMLANMVSSTRIECIESPNCDLRSVVLERKHFQQIYTVFRRK